MTPRTRTRTEVIDLWVAALRSGKYVQGVRRLRTPGDGFCCLGVLCDLATQDGGPQWQHTDSLGWFWDDMDEMPPVYMRDWLCGYSGLRFRVLADMNDAGRSFQEIAEYIVAHLRPLAVELDREENEA